MSSHPYVSQQNTPLDDDITLMSTTDLQSYITHANDTFVQVSGYQLNELLDKPHNQVRHPDMPKAAFAVAFPRRISDSSTTSSCSRVAVWINSISAAMAT
mgnify:CR=1 FL=1